MTFLLKVAVVDLIEVMQEILVAHHEGSVVEI